MDPATKLKITGALFTLVLPVGTAAAATLVGRKLKPDAEARPLLAPIAMLVAFTVSWLGINGWPGLPPASVDGYVLWGALGTGLAALAVGQATARLRPAAVGAVVVAGLALFIWRLLAPLALWADGALAPLARTAWALDAGLAAAVVALVLNHTQREAPTPVVLGPVALAMGLGAVAVGLGGSARMAQTLGALALVTGAVGLLGWRWPDVRPGPAGVSAAVVAFALVLVHAHFYVDVPRPGLALLLLAPLGAAAGARLGKTLPAVLVALGLTLAPAGLGAWLTWQAGELPAAAAPAGESEDGIYDPYGGADDSADDPYNPY